MLSAYEDADAPRDGVTDRIGRVLAEVERLRSLIDAAAKRFFVGFVCGAVLALLLLAILVSTPARGEPADPALPTHESRGTYHLGTRRTPAGILQMHVHWQVIPLGDCDPVWVVYRRPPGVETRLELRAVRILRFDALREMTRMKLVGGADGSEWSLLEQAVCPP